MEEINIKFPVQYKEKFIKELEIIKNKIDQTPNQSLKAYYFTGIGGFINRVINFDYDKKLLVIERLLFYCQSRINEQIQKLVDRARMLAIPPPEQLRARKNLPEQEDQKILPKYLTPEEVPITLINPKFFEVLSSYIEELRLAVENDEDIVQPTENIVELTYTLTGNGNYLMKKGVIKIDLE